MRTDLIYFNQFRNLKTVEIYPHDGVNIIYGDNGQGKTNLLEAIWLFTGAQSFRQAKNNEMIKFDTSFAQLKMNFYAEQRDQQAELRIEKVKTAILNGVKLSSASELNGRFCAIVFSPAHLTLVKGGPGERRRFIDGAICQVMPRYIEILSAYNKILSQRNALLKDCAKFPTLLDTIDVWDEKLCAMAGEIYIARKRYTAKLNRMAQDIYCGLAGENETFNMKYCTQDNNEYSNAAQFCDDYIKKLKESIGNDVAQGYTTKGVHRDDIDIYINGYSARSYGSQGQQRSAVLAMKLAEARLLEEITCEMPVALLDDVMSELDIKRQDFILHHLDGWQVFISCCDPAPVMRQTGGCAFEVRNGNIIKSL